MFPINNKNMTNQDWKRHVQEVEEPDVLKEWVGHWRLKDAERGGYWCQITKRMSVKNLKDVTIPEKVAGLLVSNDDSWRLHFYKDLDKFNISIFEDAIRQHPLTAVCVRQQEEKPVAQDFYNSTPLASDLATVDVPEVKVQSKPVVALPRTKTLIDKPRAPGARRA